MTFYLYRVRARQVQINNLVRHSYCVTAVLVLYVMNYSNIAMCLVTDGFHPAPQSSDQFLQMWGTGWVVIPYYYYDFKQTKATQILLLIAIKSASLTI